MKNGITELVFIIDKSGSMSGFESDTTGGFNSMIEKQRKMEGKVYVSTVLFDNESYVIHDRVDIGEVAPLTGKEYIAGGCTALLDAIGDAIHHIGNVHKYARREDVPEHTIFLITTDGEENASHKYTSARVKQMINRQTERYGWEFVFVAANIDAIETAEKIGIRRERSANYTQSAKGYALCYEAMEEFVTMQRCDAPAASDGAWKRKLEENENGK